MENVTINKEKLRATLEENLAKHETEYAEGYENWQKAVLKQLRKVTRDFKKDPKGTSLNIHLPAPQNHAHEYRETLSMLDWETGDEVVLDRHDFAQYVNDEWGWKQQFTTSNTIYAAAAGR